MWYEKISKLNKISESYRLTLVVVKSKIVVNSKVTLLSSKEKWDR